MTIQTVPFATDLVMLAAGAAVLVLVATAGVQAARGSGGTAARLAAGAAVLVGLYLAVDVGVGLASRPVQLRPGDVKCFDDWCATMTGAHRGAAGALLVDVRLENLGRGRAMRGNLARAYLEEPGGRQVAPVDGSGLHALVAVGQPVDVQLAFPAQPDLAGARFVVVEGGGGLGPGTFEISTEGSPFHAAAGWPLDAAVTP